MQPITTQSPAEPPGHSVPRNPGVKLALAAALSLVTGIILGMALFAGFAQLTHRAGAGLWSMLTGRNTTMDTSAPAVVDRIRKLNRLEAVTYSIDKIVEGERSSPVLPNFLAGDKLLLIAHGEVIAGIDLSQLKSGDISVHGDAVTLHLPPAQVLTSRIDNQRTRVYSRTTGLLVQADPTLESAARQAAEEQIVAAAKAEGILDKATQNARASLTTLLYGLGFHSVEVN